MAVIPLLRPGRRQEPPLFKTNRQRSCRAVFLRPDTGPVPGCIQNEQRAQIAMLRPDLPPGLRIDDASMTANMQRAANRMKRRPKCNAMRIDIGSIDLRPKIANQLHALRLNRVAPFTEYHLPMLDLPGHAGR